MLVTEEKNIMTIISELKGCQITNWRQARLDDAFSLSPSCVDAARVSLLKRTVNSINRQALFGTWVDPIINNAEYRGVNLYDTSLHEVAYAGTADEPKPLSSYAMSEAVRSIKEKRILFSDLYRNDVTHSIDLDIFIPVMAADARGTNAVGVLVLKINPNKFLYPFMQSNPALSTSCETYLIKKDGDNVLFLNELKYENNSAMTYFLHPGSKQCETMAINGVRGIVEGKDYRDSEVLAFIRDVPASPWILIAKMDKDEVYASIKRPAIFISLFAVTFVVGLGAWLAFIWYRQIVTFYQKQYAVEVEHRALTRKYDYLIKFANDIIIMFNKDLKIIEANDKAVSAYRYTLAEMVSMSLKDLQASETIPELTAAMEMVEKKGKTIFTTLNKRKDGSTFYVEMSIQHFIIEWNEFYQIIIRDLEERAEFNGISI